MNATHIPEIQTNKLEAHYTVYTLPSTKKVPYIFKCHNTETHPPVPGPPKHTYITLLFFYIPGIITRRGRADFSESLSAFLIWFGMLYSYSSPTHTPETYVYNTLQRV